MNAASTVLTIVIGIAPAWAVSRFEFPGRRALTSTLTAVFVLPTVVVGAGTTVVVGAIVVVGVGAMAATALEVADKLAAQGRSVMVVDPRWVLPVSADLVDLAREVATKELAPRAPEAERDEMFPRDVMRMLGRAGLMSLPYPEQFGGGDQPAEVYLQVFEELGTEWASVGVGVSVHALSCFPLVNFGTDEQKARWLPDMLGGDTLGAYCLSEPHAGSDPAAMRTRAVRSGDGYVITGAKASLRPARRAKMLPMRSTRMLQPASRSQRTSWSRPSRSRSVRASRHTPPFGVAPILAISARLSHSRAPSMRSAAMSMPSSSVSRVALIRSPRENPFITTMVDCVVPCQPPVGITNCAPARMLAGQRLVTAFRRV
mgnify:CR=1 FL=1